MMSHAFVHFKSFIISLFPADLCCDWGSRVRKMGWPLKRQKLTLVWADLTPNICWCSFVQCIRLVESIFDVRNLASAGFTALIILPSLAIALLACLKTVRSQVFSAPRQSKATASGAGGFSQGASSSAESESSTASRQLTALRVGNAFSFGLAFIFLTFLPASNLFVRVGFTIAERVLYAPSTGLALLAGLGLLYQLHKIGIGFSAQGRKGEGSCIYNSSSFLKKTNEYIINRRPNQSPDQDYHRHPVCEHGLED